MTRLTRHALHAGIIAAIVLLLPPAPQPPSGLGVGIAWQRGPEWAMRSVEMLQPPVWANWRYDHIGMDGYLPMVYTLEDDGWSRQAMQVANANPGHVWLLGNEPEQLGTLPEAAAAFTQVWATEVGGPWACCGVLVYDPALQSPNWQTWMDSYLDAGGAVPSHWHIHIYGVLAQRWHGEVERFRAWAAGRGVERPIIVSETNAHYGDAAYNAKLLDEIALRLATDAALVAVLWYSDADYWTLWPSSDLRTQDGLTALGQHYLGVQAQGDPAWRLWLPGLVRGE